MMKTALFFLLATATPVSAFSPSRNIGVSSSIRNSGGFSSRSSTTKIQAQQLEAILFDCDGVLADTERDGHRLAFNIAFKDNGIDETWGEARYGKLLEVGGGKERMTAHWNEVGWPAEIPEEGRSDKIMSLHLQKTDIFMKLIDEGAIPLRPGVLRIVDEAIAAGVKLAVCSTSNEKAVSNLVSTLMGSERASKFQIFAGDMVKKKKPAPDVYLMAVDKMGLTKDKCVIIEDSHIGVGAAVAAGISCLVTKSSYTQNEDFTGAKMIVDELGENGPITLDTLTSLLGSSDNGDESENKKDWDREGHVEVGGASWTGARMGDENINQPRTYTASETYAPSTPKSIGVKMENHIEKGGSSWTGARFGDSTNQPAKSNSLQALAARGIGVKMENHIEKGGSSWTGARFGDESMNKPTEYTPSETYEPSSPKSIGVKMENHIEKGGSSWTGARFGDESMNKPTEYTPSETYESKSQGKSSGSVWDGALHKDVSIAQDETAWTGARLGDKDVKRCAPTPSKWHE